MKLTITFWRFALFVALGWSFHASAQSAVGCGHGFDDNTCIPGVTVAAQAPPPQCLGAGYTTVVASVWQGSQWSTPQCSYQPATTCPSGYSQTVAPSWNGSSWIGLQCQPNTPPVLPASDLLTACENAIAPVMDTYLQDANDSNGTTSDGLLTFDSAGGGGFVFPGFLPGSFATSVGTLVVFGPGGTLVATDGTAALYENYPNLNATVPTSPTNVFIVEAYALNGYSTDIEPYCYINATTGQISEVGAGGGGCLESQCNGGGH